MWGSLSWILTVARQFLGKHNLQIVSLCEIWLHYRHRPSFTNFKLFRAGRRYLSQSAKHFALGTAELVSGQFQARQLFLLTKALK